MAVTLSFSFFSSNILRLIFSRAFARCSWTRYFVRVYMSDKRDTRVRFVPIYFSSDVTAARDIALLNKSRDSPR